jgi:hypothetical protein
MAGDTAGGNDMWMAGSVGTTRPLPDKSDWRPKNQGKRLYDDKELLTRVLPKAREATGWFDSKLSLERERVLQYYNGQLPRRASLGSSSFVSTDVYDAVEAVKSQLLEVFAGGDDIAKFEPDQDMDALQCEAATQYARYVIFQQNEGFGIFNDVIHDALMARIGVCKVWWEEKYDEEERSFEGLDLESVHALAMQSEVDDLEAELDEEDGTFHGTFIVRVDRSQVRIEQLPPEEFLVEPRAVKIKSAGYLAHRSLQTKAYLKEVLKFDPKKVDKVHYDDGRGLDLSPEVLARNAPTETVQTLDNPIQGDMEKVMLYESYVKMVLYKGKGSRWYRIYHVDSELFEVDEVDRPPFVIYVPLPVPHLVFGNNFAARIIPFQNANTVLTRAILDHAAMTVNPRWQVVNGGLLNPREMLDNRMGGIVNVRRPDTVAALQVPNLNPFVFQLMEGLEQRMEQTTGVSQLSQGLNKDAISKQNSRGTLQDMVNLSTQRQKIAARNFAYGFFTELMMEVIRLVILNEKRKKKIEVAGNDITVDPQSWTERTVCTVAMHLGYGERDEAVQKHLTFYQQLAQDPAMQPSFTAQNRYNLIVDTAKMAGIYGVSRYITPPTQVQPPKPDPLKMGELQVKLMDAQSRQTTAQSTVSKNQRMAAYEEGKLALEQAKLHFEAMKADRDADRQDLDTTARVDIAYKELDLQKQVEANAAAQAKEQSVINPRA